MAHNCVRPWACGHNQPITGIGGLAVPVREKIKQAPSDTAVVPAVEHIGLQGLRFSVRANQSEQ